MAFKVVKNNYHSAHAARVKQRQVEARQSPLIGKVVAFTRDGKQEIMGVVKAQIGSILEISYAVPDLEGRIVASQDSTTFESVDAVKEINLPTFGGDVKRWRSEELIREVGNHITIKDENGNPIDYRGVKFQGVASTFGTAENLDRDKEYIMEGAFDASLDEFRRNPVMLINHDRSVMSLMGHYEKVQLTSDGLVTMGVVTDSPGELAKHVRWSIVEGSLRTQSIGGAFIYGEDYRGIRTVDLHEISLVVVPANPKAQFLCRTLDAETAQKSLASRLVAGHLRAK